MGMKLGQNINFRPFLGFCTVSGLDTGRDIKSGRDINSCRDINYGRDIKSCRDINSGRDIKSGHDINSGRDIKSGRDFNSGRDIKSGRDIIFWTAIGFSSLTCQGHNFFVLTRIWACEYSLESSLNVECSREGL